MTNSITTHPDMVHIGPAKFCFWDEVNDVLVNIGKLDNLVLAKQIGDIAVLTEIVNEKMVETRAVPTAENYVLRGKFAQTLDPNTQYLVMKNCGTPSVTPTCTLTTITEAVQMFYKNQHILAHENGFYGSQPLTAPDDVTASPWGAGGTIPTGTYVFIVVPMYGTTRGLSESSLVTAIALGEKVTLTITMPAGVLADTFEIYVYNDGIGETEVDADLIGTVTSAAVGPTTITFSSWTRTTDFPGDPSGSFTVTDITGVTEYAVGIDYSIDSTCAMFCLEDGGAIEDGQWVLITYSYYSNPYVEMNIGPNSRSARIGHPVILAFHDDDRITPVGKGVEIHLWKVLLESGWEWDLSSLNFESGFEFEWKVLLDRRYMNHGKVYTFHRQFSSFGLKEFAAMTDWNNEANCETGIS